VEELDQSATALTELLSSAAGRPEPEQEQTTPLADLFADPAGQKKRQPRALFAALHGRRQPRDELGRWRSAGFDGGARTPAPIKGPPEAEHKDWLLRRLEEARGAPRSW
jgi:hypothetical protein